VSTSALEGSFERDVVAGVACSLYIIIDIYLDVCIHVKMYVYTFIMYMYIYINVCIEIYVYKSMRNHTHIYIYVYRYIYTYTFLFLCIFVSDFLKFSLLFDIGTLLFDIGNVGNRKSQFRYRNCDF